MSTSPAPRAGRDEGMTLVEVLIAAVILGILASSVLGIIVQTQSSHVDSRSRTAAASLAARELDLVREEFGSGPAAPLDIADDGVVVNEHPLAGQTAWQPLRIDGQLYTVTRSTAWNVTGPGASACEGGALVSHPTLTVSVRVTWPNMGSTKPVVTHTQLAPPKGTGVSGTQAFVAVKVVDSAGAANPGRMVRVSSAGATVSGMTDAAGCAVIAVNPATGGTTYTATMSDVGHVDVAGVTNPSRSLGSIRPGQLNTSATFAYDRAVTVRVRVVDASGTPYTDAEALGTPLRVVGTVAAGASPTRSVTATGAVTAVQSLWPTRYGAYYGTTPPAGGYPTIDLGPGQSGQVDVVLELARAAVVGLPVGADRLVAVPGGAGCTDATARDVNPGGFSVMPGQWSFYASGPAFDCATGPSGVPLGAGDNGEVLYESSTLRVSGAPTVGRLWALSTSRASGLGTCPSPADAMHAIDVDAARTAPVELPAGDWYVYRTDGGADGACLGRPQGAWPQNVPYAGAAMITWREGYASVTLRVTNASELGETKDWRGQVTSAYRIILSRTPITTCSTTQPAGAVPLATSNATTATGSIEPGTWYVYRHRYVGGSGNRCTVAAGNPYVVPNAATSYSLRFDRAGVTTP